MKAELTKQECRLAEGEYYCVEVELDDGRKFTLRASSHQYFRLAMELSGEDDPVQDCPEMEKVFGTIARKLS